MDVIEFVLDVSNIVHENHTHNLARLVNYRKLKSELKKYKVNIIPIADARTRHYIDEKHEFERLIKIDNIIQAPSGEKADYYILEYARRHPKALIISNDRFREYKYGPEIRNRFIPYKIIKFEVYFSPKLDVWFS